LFAELDIDLDTLDRGNLTPEGDEINANQILEHSSAEEMKVSYGWLVRLFSP
jgi:hypothetical protein